MLWNSLASFCLQKYDLVHLDVHRLENLQILNGINLSYEVVGVAYYRVVLKRLTQQIFYDLDWHVVVYRNYYFLLHLEAELYHLNDFNIQYAHILIKANLLGHELLVSWRESVIYLFQQNLVVLGLLQNHSLCVVSQR